jgi:hypothetical protein
MEGSDVCRASIFLSCKNVANQFITVFLRMLINKTFRWGVRIYHHYSEPVSSTLLHVQYQQSCVHNLLRCTDKPAKEALSQQCDKRVRELRREYYSASSRDGLLLGNNRQEAKPHYTKHIASWVIKLFDLPCHSLPL